MQQAPQAPQTTSTDDGGDSGGGGDDSDGGGDTSSGDDDDDDDDGGDSSSGDNDAGGDSSSGSDSNDGSDSSSQQASAAPNMNGCSSGGGCMCMPMCYPPMMYPPWYMCPWNGQMQMPSISAPNGVGQYGCGPSQCSNIDITRLLSILNQCVESGSPSQSSPAATSTSGITDPDSPSADDSSGDDTRSTQSSSGLSTSACSWPIPTIYPTLPPGAANSEFCLGPNWHMQAQSPQRWVEVNGKRLYLQNPIKCSQARQPHQGGLYQQSRNMNPYQLEISRLREELLREQKQQEDMARRSQLEISERIQKEISSQLDKFWEKQLQHDALKEREKVEINRKENERQEALRMEEEWRGKERQRLMAQQTQRDAYIIEKLRHELFQPYSPYAPYDHL